MISRRASWLATVVALAGCPADDDGESTNGGATSSVASATTDPGTTSSGTSSSSSSGSDSSTAMTPVLDVGATTQGEMDRGPYEACTDDTQCMEGLRCIALGEVAGSPTSHCSSDCTDTSSCPAHPGGAPVECIDGPLPNVTQCAVVCEMGECPEPLQCWNPALEGAPCVPT